MGRRALITGATGQDGAYLCRLLLEHGYEVFAAHRRTAGLAFWRFEELGLVDRVKLVPLEMTEYANVRRAVETSKPDEIYNLAAQSFVGASFDQPLYTSEVDALGTTRILECVREAGREIRFYQASTSEMFGRVVETPQNESTPFRPRSPYAVAKTYAHHMTTLYREAYGIHASAGVLFNHESPLRGVEFVTRKITASLALMKRGRRDTLSLGNLDAKRDWGFAGDYVEGMFAMLRRDRGDDFVLATGRTRTVREFVDVAAAAAGLPLRWEGEGRDAEAFDADGRLRVRVAPEHFRPAEVDVLLGDASKARRELGWTPKMPFETLVETMVAADLARVDRGALVGIGAA